MNKLFGNLGIGPSCTVQLEFKRPDGRPVDTISVRRRSDGQQETLPLFTNKDSLVGEVKVTPLPGKRVEHQGVRVQLLGEIELASERGHPHEFVSLVRDLAPPGDLASQAVLPFEFRNVELQYDSYRGVQVRLRYLLRVTVSRGLGSMTKDYPFWVANCSEAPPDQGPPIKMEVGIEDCLHIEFEYDRGAYALRDVVLGKIYFLLVRIRLKHMELEVRRRESVGAGAAARSDSETVAKFEIMDGAPARGEVIPIRMFLSPYTDLTPSYPNVHNKFGVRYYLNLVLVDEEDRRYFKQQEITLYRLPETAAKCPGAASSSLAPPAAAAVAGQLSPRGMFSATPARQSSAAAAAVVAAAAEEEEEQPHSPPALAPPSGGVARPVAASPELAVTPVAAAPASPTAAPASPTAAVPASPPPAPAPVHLAHPLVSSLYKSRAR